MSIIYNNVKKLIEWHPIFVLFAWIVLFTYCKPVQILLQILFAGDVIPGDSMNGTVWSDFYSEQYSYSWKFLMEGRMKTYLGIFGSWRYRDLNRTTLMGEVQGSVMRIVSTSSSQSACSGAPRQLCWARLWHAVTGEEDHGLIWKTSMCPPVFCFFTGHYKIEARRTLPCQREESYIY